MQPASLYARNEYALSVVFPAMSVPLNVARRSLFTLPVGCQDLEREQHQRSAGGNLQRHAIVGNIVRHQRMTLKLARYVRMPRGRLDQGHRLLWYGKMLRVHKQEIIYFVAHLVA